MNNIKESLNSLLRLGLILLFGGIALTLYFYWQAVTQHKSMYLIVFGAPLFGIYFLYRYFSYKTQLFKGTTTLEGLKIYPISTKRKAIEIIFVILCIVGTILTTVLVTQLS